MSNTVLIKRYASRRLYDTDAGAYVTLDDIARYIKEGKDVRVVDKDTKEDLTSQYLIQIIADRDSKGESALPLNVLTDLVRMYHAQASALTPAFLSEAVAAIEKQQEELAASPMAILNTMENWQAKQAELFSSAMNAWKAATPGAAQEAAEPKPEATQEADDRIAALEAQLKALQDELRKKK